jgi:hypothetical protein
MAANLGAGPDWAPNGFQSCASWTGEGQIALGRGFRFSRHGEGVGEVAAGFRSGASDCARSKLDVTLGVRASPHYLWLAQGFFFADRHADDTFKVQATGVKVFRNGTGLQIGVCADVAAGRFSEPALVIGYWRSAAAR